MDAITLSPLLETRLEESLALLNLGFAGYPVPIHLDMPAFMSMIRSEGLDMVRSRTIQVGGQPAGIALIARRGWTARLATMCLAAEFRGRGVGSGVMQMLIAEAAASGERAMTLEVIESNQPAVRLYLSSGFQVLRRLVSFEGEFSPTPPAAPLREIDIRSAAVQVIAYGLPELPWQISAESLAQVTRPSLAFEMEDACIVISNPAAAGVAIRSLLVKSESRRRGQAARLLQAVIAHYPGKKWLVPALCPQEAAGFFEKAGFKPGPISQLQMLLAINPSTEK